MRNNRQVDHKKLSARLPRKPSLEQLERRTVLSGPPGMSVPTRALRGGQGRRLQGHDGAVVLYGWLPSEAELCQLMKAVAHMRMPVTVSRKVKLLDAKEVNYRSSSHGGGDLGRPLKGRQRWHGFWQT